MAKKIVVIGAGASGLAAAGFLVERGAQVRVLEKNRRAAAKVRISGKGRCNITSAISARDFPENYPGNGRFLHGALHRFSNQDCIDFFRDLGVETKIERGQRVFPISDNAHEVADALERFALSRGAKLLLEHEALEIVLKEGKRAAGVKFLCRRKPGFMGADGVVVATGGLSYPATGSTGDGYRFALRLGHKIIEPRPALVPLRVREGWAKRLSGLSLKNVQLTLINPLGGQSSFFGELMFAHFGLTGPIVLTASEQAGVWLKESGQPVAAVIDLKPALSAEQLDKRLLRDLNKHSRRAFTAVLKGLLPKRLIPVVLEMAGIAADKPNHQISREERLALGSLLKKLPLTITATLPIAAAIVTAGGVDVKEIDARTMESKLKKGVFFVGEVLDIHGVTGGFNLQAAFSTAYCAAQAVEL